MLKTQLVQNVIKQLNISYLSDMLNYVLSTTQDETEPQADRVLIKELVGAFPQQTEVIMTFAQQLEQRGLQQGREEGRHEGILLVARRLLIEEGMSPQAVQKLTGLPEKEVMDLVDKH